MISPLTVARRSRLALCVLSGSEKDAEGADANGGGNGRGFRFAKRPIPATNRKGSRGAASPAGDEEYHRCLAAGLVVC